jgi:formate hydrogenlyase subunit 6/NADH:ubiquinone oxidoreductase subunit I
MRGMPGGVIEVRKRARSGLLRRVNALFPLPLLRTLTIAVLRRRSSRGLPGRALRSSDDSDQAPRGLPLLVAGADGHPVCVACGLCEFACPTDCLLVVPGDDPLDARARRPVRFELDVAACLSCGLCEEACPEEAIVMSPLDWRRLPARDSTTCVLDELLVPSERVQAWRLHRTRYRPDIVTAVTAEGGA